MSLIGLCGFAGAGKDTVAKYLYERRGYIKIAFADPLKDVVSAIFGWDREKVEGITAEDREWREKPDQWWSTALGQTITPRKMLQTWGTDIGRKQFHPKLWILSVRRKIEELLLLGYNVVVTDCRFVDECNLIKELGGKLVRIHRKYPEWYSIAFHTPEMMSKMYPQIHVSEYECLRINVDHIICNEGSIQELYDLVEGILE